MELGTDMKKHTTLFMIFLLFFAIYGLVSSCREQKQVWKGTITVENGVTVVENPKEPMYGEDALSLEKELAIGESQAGEDYLFSSIRAITVDDSDNIYVLDRKDNHVLAFDSSGKHLQTFGRPGQGPGELRLPLTLGITNRNQVVIENSRNSLVYYTTEGEYIRNVPITQSGVARIILDSQGNILGVVIKRDQDKPRYEIQKFDPEMNLLHTLDSTPTPSASSQGFNPFSGSVYFAFDKHDRAVCAVSDKYELNIYDTEGNLIKKIKKEYDPIEITEEEKREAAKEMPSELKLVFPKHHNPIHWISTDDEGRIFVMTMERIPNEEGYYHDVFDPQGRFIAKIPFRFRPRLIKRKKFYTVAEDRDGFHVIKRYIMNWRLGE
jgi:hypothetical protein